jgi:hypothetical protein
LDECVKLTNLVYTEFCLVNIQFWVVKLNLLCRLEESILEVLIWEGNGVE